MSDPSDPLPPEPANLRLLRRLVTVLTLVMIGGVIAVVTLLVIAMSGDRAPALVAPADLALPDGVAITGYALWQDRAIVVTADGRILVFDAETGGQIDAIALD